MIKDFLNYRLSIRQLVYLALVVGVPYFVIGVVWALTHSDHIAGLTGLDKLFSLLGEIVAWPVLIIADVSLT
ncbi:hypothetical protein MMAG44476_33434 [Mycolicibacterium mageritense DSM 44476 = CIP 104973]|uniref:Uncharacterized protein n=1 Tax=Mycolicibacterium mageritense TaxID=53462 RepID=A0ABN5Y7X2_MYCME|nr:hypothetical protein [Mycolicibacterium mageritense]MBN3455638.1 hypothetical protein [Mycobacterium sp. DSM 3803]OKH84194.1 hypothetical protein EB73_35010 [Mycobacterium sp. SWH-M3]MCC9185938.1 hypothetical protein [Mycolicibacterium mageritense]CDO22001.1 hypothetical protein BN978_02465 [Mycolicibacterium mageritense DSM 44476 = CIP 104973]BBX33571.1 hypothetical protein MMAGJ_28530 [Mycolicibacterium mageritense]